MNKYKIEEILSNIQFQVYSDMNFIEPLGLEIETWKELLEYINKQKEILDKIKEYLEEDDWTSVNGVIAVKLIKEKLNELLEEIE